MGRFIYADHAATTRMSDRAVAAMMPYLQDCYGNASTLYKHGRDAHAALEKARTRIARLIGAGSMEIYFTSCGSESDNWALKGTLRRLKASGKTHLITDNIEHHAVINSAAELEADGFDVTYIKADSLGRISPEDVRKAIRPETALVSVMTANNEVGTIEPIEEIGTICREAGVLFHTDAVQAAGILPFDLKNMPVDMLSASAHKFHGPKGMGFLYCRKGTVPETFMQGGEQERGHRAGTENVAAAVSMAEALAEAYEEREQTYAIQKKLRDRLQEQILRIPGTKLNGDPENRLPGNLNVSFEKIDGQSLLYELDLRGIAASSGSACASGQMNPSHVLMALGLPYELSHGSLRLTLGTDNTEEDVDYIAQCTAEIVENLRRELHG